MSDPVPLKKLSASIGRRDFIAALGSAVITPLPQPGQRSGGLLNEIEKRAVRFFYEQADQRTGLVRDRVRTTGPDTTPPPASA